MKSIIFAEGNGYGHVARDRIISEHLDVPIITYGRGAEYCRRHSMNLIEIPAPYQITSSDEKVKISADYPELVKLLKPAALSALRKHFSESDLVIVDGSPLGLVLAIVLQKKTLFITNDISSLVGVYGMLQKSVASSLQSQLFRYAKNILVPDFPPPLTITMLNLNSSFPLKFLGPLSGPAPQKSHTRRFVVPGCLEKELKPLLGDDAVYGSESQDIKPYYRDAEIVFAHGGHSTILEALSWGKPVISVVDRKYSERYNNSLMLEKNSVGVLLESRLLTPASLEACVEYASTLDKKRLSIYRRFAKKAEPLKVLEQAMAQL